jgi:putative proteasome-type protease
MTYCLAIALDQGLIFTSDSRTNAGIDQVSTYSKMHTFGREGGDRQFVLLSAGNLATTQGVVARLRRDMEYGAPVSLFTVEDLHEAAEYLGQVNSGQRAKHIDSLAMSGFSSEATFILGGQIGGRPPGIYLIYPQGNYITASRETSFLLIGESKYGKPILDRIINPATPLEDAARCSLVSMDSTMRSNATVGPPIELLVYERDSLRLEHRWRMEADDPYLQSLRKGWDEKLKEAFRDLPRLTWSSRP